MTTGVVTWPAIQRLILGRRAAAAIDEEAQQLGAQRVFLVVSKHLDDATNEVGLIRAALGSRYAGCFSGIRAHGPKSDVVAAAQRALAADADLIVAVGGGSVIDACKVLLICLRHRIGSVEQLDAFRAQFRSDGTTLPVAYDAPTMPLVCVPTTLSGGEFNTLAGALDEATQRKHGFEHRALAPRAVVLDPALTLHTPAWLWNSTGVRAVDHAVETLASYRSNAFCDGIADSALRLLAEGLVAAHRDPTDLEARLQCQTGAAQAILPLVSGVPMGASHAIGHLLGAVAGVPHGYTSCVMAPCVQAWNAEVPNPRLPRIAACLGEAATPVADLLDRLIRGLGMPRTLPAVGVKVEHLQSIADGTLNDIWGRTNPRPLETAADVRVLLERASTDAWAPPAAGLATSARG